MQSIAQLWAFRAFPGDVGCPHREGRPWRAFKRIPHTQLTAGKSLNLAQLPQFAKVLLKETQKRVGINMEISWLAGDFPGF